MLNIQSSTRSQRERGSGSKYAKICVYLSKIENSGSHLITGRVSIIFSQGKILGDKVCIIECLCLFRGVKYRSNFTISNLLMSSSELKKTIEDDQHW